ncbi:MAG: bifunctional phosphoribosylaminoimidazolecarboxamide formyltransferase/IMP cyclohydrolase, partial [Proteobacteria bacterium]
MEASVFKNALVSVSDKSGLVEFLKPFVDQGLRVVSTGGTLKHLRENGIRAFDVTEQTGFPEVMDGRVKTLHPRVHMALLARSSNSQDEALLKKEDLEAFDLVVVNLYPFEQAKARGVKGDELIEYIDVGGPSMLRAAAKNHERIAVVCQPSDYKWIADRGHEESPLSLQDRRSLAASVFRHTAAYDDLIAKSLDGEQSLTLSGQVVSSLRYGENPHQKAWWLRDPAVDGGLHDAKILHGKALSYNNLLDLDAAVGAVSDFSEPCAVAVKHNNPCGVGTETTLAAAVKCAIDADPVSVFGGIIALNRIVDLESAEIMGKIFLECIIAPGFEPAALERLQKKKDLRLLEWPKLAVVRQENQF